MTDIKTILKYKDILVAKKSKQDRLFGQLESKKAELKKLGYNTLKDAEKALDNLEEDIETMEENLKQDIKQFEKEYGDLIS